ncbi:HAMP domain-containing histidine kinase [Elizabethkingia ursingii]|uniref:sensor histidine kinase n=1 Tax=Elizabethkingia ursingii TaxID=1756150 RepID=UPI0020123978|nr:HAMP domain-containing sensor histidine kinase [Elizabethkingia ursingii]MCL1669308.1 HAMP domain-containing histidine kinase [Elizabethkingia ursingii]
MLKNYKWLVSAFALLFLLLVGIQIYFLYKTYQIKESNIYNQLDKNLDRDQSVLRKKLKISDDTIQKRLISFNKGEITKKQLLDFFTKNKEAVKPFFSHYVDSIASQSNLEVAVSRQYKSILSTPDNKYILDSTVTIYETNRLITKVGRRYGGEWETSTENRDDKTDHLNKFYEFKVKTYYNLQILNIKSIVFRDLTILIISCILILAAVLWLFTLTIKNLISQQKQVEILHTVVDNISHEFKTPIATLKIAAKSLRKDWNPENLPLVERQINRLESLMQQLQENDDDENAETYYDDWNNYIEDLQFANAKVEFVLHNTTPNTLPFNRTAMETLIKNLCENSAKYGATRVEIDLRAIQNTLNIKVADNGNGIPKKEQQRIFEKFYRIQSDNIHNTKGLGLGLFLVKDIVTRYNGSVELISEPGKGTTFKIALPYEN